MIVEELAALLKEHPENIRRWIRQGKVKATKIGKRYDIPMEEVNRLKNEFDYNEYVKINAQAVGQLLASNEASFEATLALIHRIADSLVNILEDVVGVSAKDKDIESYEKRRLYYEENENTYFHALISEVGELIKLEQFNKMLKETLKREEDSKEILNLLSDPKKFG